MKDWMIILIIISSLIFILLLTILSLIGVRLCQCDNNPWGILILFITLNIIGLIIGILIISNNNKKIFNKMNELNLNINDFLEYYKMNPSEVEEKRKKENFENYM